MFMQAIKKKSQEQNSDITISERQSLVKLLQLHLPSMHASTYASITLSLGMLSSNMKSWRGREESDILLNELNRIIKDASSNDLALIFVGFARLQINWGTINQKRRSIQEVNPLESHLLKYIHTLDEKQIGDIIWSLGAMGTFWSVLSLESRSLLIKSLETKAILLNSYALSSVLWAMAKMGVKWKEFPSDLQQTFLNRLVEFGAEMSPQQSSKALWALGTLGATYNRIPTSIFDIYLENVGTIKRSKMGSAVPASQTLTGIAKTGITWSKLSANAKAAIWEQLTRVCQSTNDRGIANAIWAMGTMAVPSDEFPSVILDAVISGISRVSSTCTSWALCNIIWGMAKMKFLWDDFSPQFISILMTSIIRVEDEMNGMDVGILIWSLGTMDCPLDTLPRPFLDSLLRSTVRNLDTMKPQDLSKTIWGLSGTGLDWDSLPPALQWNINVALRRVGQDMAPQDVANSAYALAILSFDTQTPSDPSFRGAHEVLLNTIRKACNSVSSRSYEHEHEIEQLRIFSQYLRVMSFATDEKRIPAELLSSAGWNRTIPISGQGSALQNRVVGGLREALQTSSLGEEFVISPEASSFEGVFPVDAAISHGGRIIAILEVDGPHHYRRNGSLRRKDKLKEAMYTRKHPLSSFHRIRWDDVTKHGSDVVGAELAGLVISAAKNAQEVNPFTSTMKSFQTSLSDFFSWGLRNGG